MEYAKSDPFIVVKSKLKPKPTSKVENNSLPNATKRK